jgi:protein-disulfide isomerase
MSPLETDSDQHSLTRKQRRDHARSQRKAAEQAELQNAVRRTRFTQLAIVAAVIVIGIVAVLIGSGGSGENHAVASGGAAAKRVDGEVSKLLAGIPQSANVLGQPTAPVTLQYFGDLECPVCRAFTLSSLPSIISNQVRAGTLRIEYHSLETATREPEVFKAQQIAALAAGRQNKMWNFIETFYHEQGEEDSGYVTEKFIQGIAAQVPGLKFSKWTSDRGESALANQVETDAQTATDERLEGTPAFLLGHSGGALRRYEPTSYTNPSSFEAAIEKLAKGSA